MGFTPMTASECHERASACAANAALAVSEPIALEFLKLAAQWRAMAARLIYLGPIDEPRGALRALNGLAPRPGLVSRFRSSHRARPCDQANFKSSPLLRRDRHATAGRITCLAA